MSESGLQSMSETNKQLFIDLQSKILEKMIQILHETFKVLNYTKLLTFFQTL